MLQRFGRASRKFFRMFWNTMSSCHRPEQTTFTFSTPSASSDVSRSLAQTRVSSPYNGVPYNRVSSLMDVDYFRGSMNADGVSQNGHLDLLRVVNPDLSSKSNSELNDTTTADRADTAPLEVVSPPYLPDLYFESSPEPSLSCVMALSYEILTNVLREDAIPHQAGHSAHPRDRAEGHGAYSLASLDESPIPSIAHLVTWSTVPRELFLTPLGSGPHCQRPVTSRSYRKSHRLTCTTDTSSSDGHSTLFSPSIESLVDLVHRFDRQWPSNGRPQLDRTSKVSSSSHISASSTVPFRSRKLSWSWGLFLSADSLLTMPLVLAAANIAQTRRLHRRFVRRTLA